MVKNELNLISEQTVKDFPFDVLLCAFLIMIPDKFRANWEHLSTKLYVKHMTSVAYHENAEKGKKNGSAKTRTDFARD